MLNGKYQGTDVGSGTAVWRWEEDLLAGRMTQEECAFAEGCMARSNGHCMTMGTASTMASMAEALGMQLPYSATWPAVDARRYETAQRAGQVIVDLVENDVTPDKIMTREAFENAIRVNAAIGGSTNAVIHLLAIAGRLGVPLRARRLRHAHQGRADPGEPAAERPVPDGGLLLRGRAARGHARARRPAARRRAHRHPPDRRGERQRRALLEPRRHHAARPARSSRPAPAPRCCAATWRPDGAVIKQSAASPHLLKHRGRALVFDSPEAYHQVAADPDLDVDEDTVLVIRYCGPGATRACRRPPTSRCPPELLKRGVRDIVRICDGRMSGTAYGTVVLHVAPEAAAGGPLALVRTGDLITLDVPARTLTLDVPDDELAARRAAWTPPPAPPPAAGPGCTPSTCSRPNTGCDLDFLTGASGAQVGRDSH